MSARLGACYFLCFAFIGTLAPYLSLYLHEAGSSTRDIAILMAVLQSMRLLGPYLWVGVTDKGVSLGLTIGLTTLGSLCGVAGLLNAQGFGALFFAMVILSIFWSGALPLLEAMTLSHLKGRVAAYGPIRMWGSQGFICATLVAGQLIDHYTSTVVPWIFLLILAGLLPISFALPSNISADRSRPSALWSDLKATLGQSGPVAVLGAGFLMAAAHGAFNVFFSIHLSQHGYGGASISALWALGSVCEMLILMLMPHLDRLFAPHKLLLTCFMAAIVRFAMIGWGVENMLLMVFAQSLHALSFGVHHATSVSMSSRWHDTGNPARSQALYASFYGGGTLFGGLLSGGLWSAIGGAWTFGASSALAAVGMLFIFSTKSRWTNATGN